MNIEKPILVFMNTRNRIATVQKTIEALFTYTKHPVSLFVWDNCTQVKIEEHFTYFGKLYAEGKLKKYTVNSLESTYNAFGKVSAWNDLCLFLEAHPNKNMYEFVICIDDDICVIERGYDLIIQEAMELAEQQVPSIMIIGQSPGGISGRDEIIKLGGKEVKVRVGTGGGSGLWCFRPDLFSKIGALDIEPFVGISKRQDITVWGQLNAYTDGKPYILGIDLPLALHTSFDNGVDMSICKKARNEPSMIVDYPDYDAKISNMTFDEYITFIKKDIELLRKW